MSSMTAQYFLGNYLPAFNETIRKDMISISLPFLYSSENSLIHDFLLQRSGAVFEASVQSTDDYCNVV